MSESTGTWELVTRGNLVSLVSLAHDAGEMHPPTNVTQLHHTPNATAAYNQRLQGNTRRAQTLSKAVSVFEVRLALCRPSRHVARDSCARAAPRGFSVSSKGRLGFGLRELLRVVGARGRRGSEHRGQRCAVLAQQLDERVLAGGSLRVARMQPLEEGGEHLMREAIGGTQRTRWHSMPIGGTQWTRGRHSMAIGTQ